MDPPIGLGHLIRLEEAVHVRQLIKCATVLTGKKFPEN
jgi:hypothetical protein